MGDATGRGGGAGGSWTQRLVVVGVALALLILAVVHDRFLQPRPSATAGAVVTTRAASAPTSAGPPATVSSRVRAPVAPLRLHGLALRSRGGPVLLLSGTHPAWFAVGTHALDPIRGLPASRLAYQLTSLPGGWAAQVGTVGNPDCNTCAGPRTTVYFIAGGSGAATRIGRGNAVAAAAGTGAVWLTSFASPQADTTFEPATTQEVDLAGRPLGPPARLPAGYLVSRGVDGGLLLAAVEPGPDQPSAFELWNPRTGRVAREFPDVIGATPGVIAWLGGGCSARACPIHILELATGRSATVRPPSGYWASEGALSSDGRLLAVQMNAGAQQDGEAVLTRLEVLDTTSLRLSPVPGMRLGGAAGLSFGWQATSECLVATVSGARTVEQVAAWHPGEGRLSVAAVHIPLASAPVLEPGL